MLNELLNYSNTDHNQLAEMNHHKIDFNKFSSKLSIKSRKDSKPSKCLFCLEDTTQFCNSHTVPASFLKNIAVSGKVFTTNEIIDLPILDREKGIEESGTFHLICRDCDSKIFQEYENPNNYEKSPNSKMIAQIAMKNHLRSISKRRFEIPFYNNLKEELPNDSIYVDQIIKVCNLDLNDYIRGFKRAKKIIEKGWNNEYHLFFYKKLNYIVPIACQCEVALMFDFHGNIINHVHNENKGYKIHTLHVSIFPLETASIIMIFVDKNHKRYRTFYKQFKNLTREEQLAAVNFIIFNLSEDIYISKNIHYSFLKNELFKKITGLTSAIISDSPVSDTESIKKSCDFSQMNSIPNLLLININNVSFSESERVL